ncbi:hypothetical protein C1634_023625 [Chryseobacterium viscerum]|uniref:Uncharacterized protein n=1 Tax=Chryseobacterium viscerum TaxID=1037377 RepID=A0A316WAC0_9FLAO|nr:hypothetical protein C1634_023625 [Chryseobacterium viscerum]
MGIIYIRERKLMILNPSIDNLKPGIVISKLKTRNEKPENLIHHSSFIIPSPSPDKNGYPTACVGEWVGSRDGVRWSEE